MREPKPLRVWPGVIAVVLLLLARFGLKAIIPGFRGFSLGMMWSLAGVGTVLLWWLLFSRARWLHRFAGLALMIAGLGAAWLLRHESLGPLWLLAYALPAACATLVAGAAASRHLPDRHPLVTIAAAFLVVSGAWTLVRMEGISGDHDAIFRWRWTKTTEQKLLTEAPPAPLPAPARAVEPAAPRAEAAPVARAVAADPIERRPEWPGFRGLNRDGVVRGVQIETDWAASPPVEIWRRPVGPGWSSFAVRGNRIFTQEQRGDDEVVACYDAATGAPVWTHRDPVRFFESNGGAGPRGTPTLGGDRLLTLGATGVLNALETADGRVVWSRNAATDTGVEIPYWGFSSSPLIVDDEVIVAVSGTLAAYDLATGKPRWTGPSRADSYSSPHVMTIAGVRQVVHMSGSGLAGFSPADGAILWEHPWKGTPIVQPAFGPDGDVFISASGESGIRRIAVKRGAAEWSAERRWGSNGLKPYFNDFVVHEGHAYGFDGRILSCIDVADGARKWKGGRYGNGQLVLLADQDLLLVLSEDGELALVNATPDQFTEVARFKAIEGKTWNHPVVVGGTLLVRNGDEMAAFRLPRRGR